jgi:hypothetical protein
MHARSWLLFTLLSPACQCDRTIEHDTDDATSTGTSTTSDSATASSSEESTGAPFDASRWLGRYHFETAFLEFGERGEFIGSAQTLSNFEIFADGTATMLFEYCAMSPSRFIHYEWEPDEPGWIALHPGEGETTLRMEAAEDLDSLRVHLIEPCRELELEMNGRILGFTTYRPGASCWVARCPSPNIYHVDYCEGEEPPPCP